MAAYSAFEDAVYDALSPIFPNNQLIWSHGNGTEPENSYVSLYILSFDQIGSFEHSTNVQPVSGNDYSLLLNTHYEVLVQFMFRGPEAGDLQLSFNQSLNNPYYWEIIDKNNLSIMRKSPIRQAPQKRDTAWILGFNQDITFSFSYTEKQIIDPIEKIVLKDLNSGESFTIPN